MENIKKSILLTFILLLSITNSLFSQLKEDLKNEIIVYILPDSMEFQNGQEGEVSHTSLNFKSSRLLTAFDKINANAVSKGFPNFKKENAIKTREDGFQVSMPDLSRIFRIRLAKKEDVDSAIAHLLQVEGVLYAEKHTEAELCGDPDYATKQWFFNNTGQSGGTSGADIRAEQTWQIFTGSSSVKIGIFDTGVEITHDEFVGKATGDGTLGSQHGTHVAGIAAAKANNDKGGRGVDWNAQIVSKRIFEATTLEGSGYVGDIVAASQIYGAVNDNVNIFNHSWRSIYTLSSTLKMAFAYAYKMNCVTVAAMGNDYSSSAKYPAALGQGVIAVGASSDNDTKADYSNTGNHIDVVAPGGIRNYPNNDMHDIWSTWTENSYRFLAGTSMATPVVSGLASLLKGYNSTLYNDDIERIIQLSADKVSAMNGQNFTPSYGYGRVNTKKALDYLRAPYLLDHYTATGGTDLGASSTYTMGIYGAPNLTDGNYSVKRHEVQRYVTFPDRIEQVAWGDGAATTGWANITPNMTMGWSEVVPGTLTNYSATLRTYVYEVYSGGYFIGWYPCDPSNVSFTYTVLGKPVTTLSATISGLMCVVSKGSNVTLTANPTGGTGTYSYLWSPGGFTTQAITRPVSNCPTTWTVTVTSGTQTANASKSVYYQGSGCDCGELEKVVGGSKVIPDKFELMQNYPNPFNPTTTLKFGIPEPAHVSLKIYNLQGKEIKTLVDQYLEASYYESQWDGTDDIGNQVASGIYIYRVQSGKYVESKKMMFIK